MEKKLQKLGILCFVVLFVGIVALVFANIHKKKEANVANTREGKWNETHTIYTNANGISVTENELAYLKSVSRYGIQSEEDMESFFQENQVEDFFPIKLKYEDQIYEAICNDWIVNLPDDAKEIGQVKHIYSDQDRVYEEIENMGMTKNADVLGIEEGDFIFQSSKREEVLYVKAGTEDHYCIFTKTNTGFTGEWNEDHTIYTNAHFVEIPKEVYDLVVKEQGNDEEKALKIINYYYQMDVSLNLPIYIRYNGKLYSFSLLGENEKNLKASEQYMQEQAFVNGIKEVGTIKKLVGDNSNRVVQELEITANAGGYPLEIKVGTPIYQSDEEPKFLLLKNSGVVFLGGDETGENLEKKDVEQEGSLATQEYLFFMQVEE